MSKSLSDGFPVSAILSAGAGAAFSSRCNLCGLEPELEGDTPLFSPGRMLSGSADMSAKDGKGAAEIPKLKIRSPQPF